MTTARSGVNDMAGLQTVLAKKLGNSVQASSGVGTPLNLAGEVIKRKSGLFMKHIPCRGAATMTTDLLGGHVNLAGVFLSSGLVLTPQWDVGPLTRGQLARFAKTVAFAKT